MGSPWLTTTYGSPGTADSSTARCGSASFTAGVASSSTRTPRMNSSIAGNCTVSMTTPHGLPFLKGSFGVHAAHRPASRGHPLPRLANGARARATLRDLRAHRDARPAGLFHDPQLRAPRTYRRTYPLGHRVEPPGVFLR